MDSDYVWLTDLSKQFLERDYLLAGQTTDERVDVICQAAENILQKPGYAKSLKDNIKKGWYSLSTPIWTNFGTDRGLPISCVVGNTWINTKEGKYAKDIRIGDMVLTHNGRFRKITDVIVTKQQKDIYELTVIGTIYVTGNHLVLTNCGWVRVDELIPKYHLVAANGTDFKTKYVKIGNLVKTDKVEDVYDFTVEKDHSFCANGIVLHNCYGSHISDNMESILRTQAEVGMMTKLGGGTSAYFGELRSRGAPIRDNGESSGSVHFMQLFENLINVVSQGKTRRGNFAAYLPIDHKDIMEFLAIRGEGNPLQDISFGICIPDYWMEEMIAGDMDKRKVWAKVLECRASVGYPYIVFIDNVNNNAVEVYKNKGMRINHSNLCCVTGDQRVVTTNGLKTVKSLYEEGGDLTLYDNKRRVNASSMKLIKKNAPVYKITLSNGLTHTVTACHRLSVYNEKTSLFNDVACRDLKIGDKVQIQTNKGVFGKIDNVDEDLIWQGTEAAQRDYINKLFVKNKDFIVSDNEDFLQKIQLILANLGITTSIKSDKLVITRYKYAAIASIEYAGLQDVYCCQVDSQSHHWICNGVVTHNSEIMLADSEEESFVCDLSSMNILHYDAWKDTNAVEILTYLLDAVMTEFINKAKNIAFMERSARFAERQRALGIGWLGWHSYLQSKMIPFESMQAKLLNVEIAKNIKEKSYAASAKMAQEYGEPELLKGIGRRHVTTCAIAPTKSSAFIMGQVSENIEPHRTNYYIKDLQKGKYTIKNTQLEKVLDSKGRNDDETWMSILKNSGSVQHLDCLTQHEKDVFKTFAEISPKEVIIQASQRQKHIDQGQSLNLMIHPSIPIKDVNALLIEAWKMGIKSLYYQYSVNAAQEFSRDILACQSCQ